MQSEISSDSGTRLSGGGCSREAINTNLSFTLGATCKMSVNSTTPTGAQFMPTVDEIGQTLGFALSNSAFAQSNNGPSSTGLHWQS
jgi:hypothetical protein